MPLFVPEAETPQTLMPTGVAPPNPIRPSVGETVAAAFRQDNPLVSVASRLSDEQYPAVPGHNPLSTIAGTEFEQQHLDRFIGSQSPDEDFAIIRRIAEENTDRRTLDASGFPGTVAQFGAGLLDPTIALPAGSLVRGVRGGVSVLRSARSIGLASGGATVVSEGALQASHETRTLGESTAAIASSTLLGGLIGMGAASLLSKAERSALVAALDHERAAMDAHADNVIRPDFTVNRSAMASPEAAPAPASSGLATAAGAAATDTRALELERSGLGFSKILSTTRRVLSSASTSARRAMADLAETPYRFTENEAGVATTQGPALDRLARMEINGARVEVGDGLERLFAEYRFGDPEKSLPRLKARFEDLTGAAPDRMSYDEFKAEVSRALIENDTHAVPQVQQAAQLIRSRVFEPWKERAIAAGLLPEGVEVKTAASYFQRVYNKERIRAERPFFVNKVVDWLHSDQMTKAAAKDRLTALNDELNHARFQIDKAKSPEDLLLATTHHDEVRAKMEEEIARWEGKTVAEAKQALKAREQYARQSGIAFGEAHGVGAGRPDNAARLRSADDAIDKAIKDIIESDRDLSVEDLRARAHEITERILGSPDGRLPYDIPTGGPEIGWRGGADQPRGPLAAREFNIPDAVIRDFLEQDVEHVVQTHLRTMVPDVLLTERFGDVRMTEAFKRVEEDYARLTDAASSNKERDRLGKERDAVIRDLAAVRDRVRGVYGWSPELRNMARVAAGAKSVNNLTSMGVSAISSLPDFAGAVFRWGLSGALGDGWAPYLRYLTGNNEGWDKFKTQMRAVGIGIETSTNARQHALDDVTDVYKPGSRFERGLQMVNDRFFIANLLAPLTDIQKTIAAHVSVSEILRTAKAAAEGKATKKQLGNLAESGIDQQMAGRIWEQFQNGGTVTDGVHLPNTADWTDKAAADALNGAVARDVDIAVVTPGQEKPLWMSHPVLSVLGQFKAFTAASTERILVANLMRRDAHALSGLVASVGLGMLSYKLNSFFGGQETSARPQDWIKEGISRGGVLGWFEEGNAMASKMTRGGVDIYRMIGADKPLSRFASRSTLDMLLGPTAAKISALSKVTGAAASRDWTEADTTALRRLMAFQNLVYLRGLFNQAEGGLNGYFGVPHREPSTPRQP